jgi:hypothetical protein
MGESKEENSMLQNRTFLGIGFKLTCPALDAGKIPCFKIESF